jgi:ADP-ribose pyrophosphatase YjhB (NUDIX family)
MQILAEIHHAEGINIQGKTVHRNAVRAVILRGQELLMVYSANVGDYKFPGGGVHKGESYAQALHREVQEECGMSLLQVGDEICRVVEYV